MSNYNPNTSSTIPPTDDNPWADPARDNLRQAGGQHQQQQQHQQTLNPPDNNNNNNPFYQPSNSPNPWQLNQGQDSSNSGYAPPPGPPPPGQSGYQPQQNTAYTQNAWSQQQQQHQYPPQQGQGLAKAPTFNENDFVPADERGEQREAMEQFEITNSRPQSTDDRNVETLQQEFPALDGSLVAAIYMDSKQMGAVREMLRELNGGS
jgi:hypothetical protein